MDRIAEDFLACNAALNRAKSTCCHMYKDNANEPVITIAWVPSQGSRTRKNGRFILAGNLNRAGH